MNEEHRLILKMEHNKLSKVKLEDLTPFLKEYKIFNQYMWKDIKTTEAMLDELPHRGPTAFQNLIEILRKAEYVEEADQLESHTLAKKVDPGLYYILPTKPLGYCLIINNVDFGESEYTAAGQGRLETRPGSDVDADSFRNVLKKIGFEVDVKRNKTAIAMYNSLVDFSRKDFTNVHSAIIIILSHGSQNDNKDFVYGTDGEYIFKDKIRNIFNNENCVQLQNKPRVFFFVCCRGKDFNYGVELHLPNETTDCCGKTVEYSTHKETDSSNVMPTLLDILCVHSTLPNQVSVSDDKGSYFCQEFIKILEEYFLEHDLDTMINLVNIELAKRLSVLYRTFTLAHVDSRGQRKKFMFCKTCS